MREEKKMLNNSPAVSPAEAGRKRRRYVESTAIIMGRVEETWVMNVGVAVAMDKNEGGVLIKVEVCNRKRGGKHEKRYRIEKKAQVTALVGGELDVLPTS